MSKEGMNVRFLGDVKPVKSYILHSSEARTASFNSQRNNFLNLKGQDYFILNPREQEAKEEAWKQQAIDTYPEQGDYLFTVEEGVVVNVEFINLKE